MISWIVEKLMFFYNFLFYRMYELFFMFNRQWRSLAAQLRLCTFFLELIVVSIISSISSPKKWIFSLLKREKGLKAPSA
ncbi:hypothetical protein C6Y02_08110 [Bacillus sp. NMCC4]|nr:hypothetical protein C6Y02_08110 [Bacillus sp. NMCC4]